MRLFVFGTLLDPDVVPIVVGRPLDQLAPRRARLDGFTRRRVLGESFPFLVAQPGGEVEGLVIGPFTRDEIERIRFFEGDEFEFGRVTVRVEDEAPAEIEVHACLSTGKIADSGEPWTLTRWQATEKLRALAEIEGYMALFGTIAEADADACWAEVKRQAGRRFAEARAERHFTGRRRR